MSEQRLRELGREAEQLVDLPDLGSLERRGRALRFRRQAGVVAAAAVVATAGVFLFQDRTAQAPQPAPRSEQFSPYPGVQMQDLEAGTYELTPSSNGAEPTALVTVPSGWNSWVGPNRFDGHRPGDSNDAALARSTWVVGVVVLKVQGVATERCQPFVAGTGTELDADETVAALRQLPGYRSSVDDGVGDSAFGHPSTLVHLTPGAAQQACARESEIFATDSNAGVGMRGELDLYVVDVEGTTYVVVANEFGEPPQTVRDEQARVLASVEFVLPQ